MAEVLELAHLSKHYRMAEVYIGAGRVQAELDAKPIAFFGCIGEFFGQFVLGENLDRTSL
jgi:hypothetical protein